MGPADSLGSDWKVMFIPNDNDFDPARPTMKDLENAIDISSAVTWDPITFTYDKEEEVKFAKGDQVRFIATTGNLAGLKGLKGVITGYEVENRYDYRVKVGGTEYSVYRDEIEHVGFKIGDDVEYLDDDGKWRPGKVTDVEPKGIFGEDGGPSPYQIDLFWFKGKRGVRARRNYKFKSYGAATTLDLPKSDDVVNHPSYYTSDPSGVECITITRHRNFNIGNAFKYLWRNGLKDSVGKDKRAKQIEDLKKAVFHINDEIKRLGGTP